MQQDRGQDQRHPFDMFGGFGNFGGLGGSISGRDPFDDPFFSTRPSGGMFNQSNFVGGSRPVIPPAEPIIRELNSEDDEDESYERKNEGKEGAIPANEPFINHPDDQTSDDEKDPDYRADYNRAEGAQPQAFKVHSCKVTYGGVDGVYYSSSSTRRMGSDGVIVEECKEADKSKGEAKHRISRGLHDKGHTVTRKLNSDGNVDTSQTLHNLHEDELGSFEEAWRSNSGNHLPHWTEPRGTGMGSMSNTFLLPSTRHMGSARGTGPNDETRVDPSGGRSKKVVRIPIE